MGIVTVISPAKSHDLTTLAAVKEDLALTTTTNDTVLTKYIRRASAIVEAYLRHVIGIQTVSEHFMFHRIRIERQPTEMVLSNFPVISITSITENGTVLTTNDYKLDTDAGVVLRVANDVPICWGFDVVVVYQAGYKSIPADVEDVVLDIISSGWNNKSRDTNVQQEAVTGVGSVQYYDRGTGGFVFDDGMKTQLNKYRKVDW